MGVVSGVFVGAGTSFVDAPHSFAPMPRAVAPIVGFVGSVDSFDIGAFSSNGLVLLPDGCFLLILVGRILVRALEFFQEGVEDDELFVFFLGFGLPFLFSAELVVFNFDFEHELLAAGEVSFSVLRLRYRTCSLKSMISEVS